MKKKLSLIALFAAILALSSCVLEDPEPVVPSDTPGTLNIKIEDGYKNYYYIGEVTIKEGGIDKQLWTIDDHLNTYTDGAHINFLAGNYYDIKVKIYRKSDSSLFETQTISNVSIRAGKGTTKTITPNVPGELKVTLSNTYNDKLYINAIYIQNIGSSIWIQKWDVKDHMSDFRNGSIFSLNKGTYNVKVEIYKFRENEPDNDSWYENKFIDSVTINPNQQTSRSVTPSNPNPGTLKVKLSNTYSDLLFIGEVKVNGSEQWNSDDHPSDWKNGASFELKPGTYSIEVNTYKQNADGTAASKYQTFTRDVTIIGGQTNYLTLTASEPKGTLKVSIDYAYQNYYYIGEIYTKQGSSSWTKVWDANSYVDTYRKKAEVKLTEGKYDIKFVTYKVGDIKDTKYTEYTRENYYITSNQTTYFTFGSEGIEP